jgi:alpha/beta superfamily hydrolase
MQWARASIKFAGGRGLPDPWLLGWSFGSDVVLRHGDVDPVQGAILLSPPLHYSTPADLGKWAASRRPLVALVPEFDDYLPPAEARRRFSAVAQCEIEAVEGARHLWVGESYVRIVLDEIVRRVHPEAFPLPTTWSGPMTHWNDLA